MKTIVTFECEACGFRDASQEVVAACEAAPVERVQFAVGDIVTGESAYGWWHDDKLDWFHVDRGDPNSADHHERSKYGYPLFVVLAIVPYKVSSPSSYGRYAHREVAILWSPKHANRVYEGDSSKSYRALMFGTPLQKVREATPGELETLRSQALAFDPSSREGRALAEALA